MGLGAVNDRGAPCNRLSGFQTMKLLGKLRFVFDFLWFMQLIESPVNGCVLRIIEKARC